jgi:hypothetical protein
MPRVAGLGLTPGSADSTLLQAGPDPMTPEEHLITRSTYRHLLVRGLAPEEAAALTAFMCGIPIAEVRWSLRQINQLLFLRRLAATGRFGALDGEGPRPH